MTPSMYPMNAQLYQQNWLVGLPVVFTIWGDCWYLKQYFHDKILASVGAEEIRLLGPWWERKGGRWSRSEGAWVRETESEWEMRERGGEKEREWVWEGEREREGEGEWQGKGESEREKGREKVRWRAMWWERESKCRWKRLWGSVGLRKK